MDDGIPAAGEVWWVQLAPTMGTEQSGKRPFLVISPKAVNGVIHRVIGGLAGARSHIRYFCYCQTQEVMRKGACFGRWDDGNGVPDALSKCGIRPLWCPFGTMFGA